MSEQLEPVYFIFSENEILYIPVFRIFDKLFKDNVSFQVIILTTFSSEFACGVKKEDNHYVAVKLVVKTPISRTTEIKEIEGGPGSTGSIRVEKDGKDITDSYLESLKKEYPADYKEIGVEEYTAKIDEEIHDILLKVWRKMLLARSDTKVSPSGLDGVAYIFSIPVESGGRLSGQTWSPASKTNCGRLVTIAHLLEEYCSVPENERGNIATEIRNKADELLRLWKDAEDGE